MLQRIISDEGLFWEPADPNSDVIVWDNPPPTVLITLNVDDTDCLSEPP